MLLMSILHCFLLLSNSPLVWICQICLPICPLMGTCAYYKLNLWLLPHKFEDVSEGVLFFLFFILFLFKTIKNQLAHGVKITNDNTLPTGYRKMK